MLLKQELRKDVDKAARDVIEAAGYGEYFNHGLGHGLGIGEDGEGPTLNSKSETVLQEHMMMSCEQVFMFLVLVVFVLKMMLLLLMV